MRQLFSSIPGQVLDFTIVFTGIVGNLFTLLPWPLDQIDHGTESTGHLLVLVLGLVLLREKAKCGECKEAVQ